MSTLTAGAPADVLLDRLEHAGWGTLAGPELRGVRGVLAALTRTIDPRTGAGKATANQIADRAGYTPRWTRRCLQILEELELIEWDRGGIVDGRPTPSWFRVSKAGLLALVQIARAAVATKLTRRQQETRARINRYDLRRTKRRRATQTRRSDHAEVRPRLLSIEETPAAADTGPPADPAKVTTLIATIKAQLRTQRHSPRVPRQ